MCTTFKKEWGYFIENPVLAIKRPKNPEPRNRRFTEAEINLLLRGNRTNEQLRTIIEIALETGMRQSEILNIHPEHIKDQTLFIPVAKTKPRLIPLTKAALVVLRNATLLLILTGTYWANDFVDCANIIELMMHIFTISESKVLRIL